MPERSAIPVGGLVQIKITEGHYTPEQARMFARRLQKAAYRAEFVANHLERMYPVPEAAAVGMPSTPDS